MSRRGAALLLFLGAASSLTWALRSYLASAVSPGDFSLLMVTVDTTRPDHLEPYGATDVDTPSLAALAREGVVFDHAYAVAPVTLPAHTSLMTGLYPPQHGVRNNGSHFVAPAIETLAETLRERGFRTAAFVSAAVLEDRFGLDQGFEVYDDDLSTSRSRYPRMVPDRPAYATVDAALRWLSTLPSDRRFFLWVHLYDPHAAYSPPPPYRDLYRDRPYDGEIAYMDSQIGRLLRHARVSRPESTIVLVIGDHGESLGEHQEQTHGILPYDATLRIPWLLRAPGLAADRRFTEPVSQVDVMPTVLDLLGVGAARGLPGRSVVPRLGSASEPSVDGVRPLYAEAYLPFYTYGWAKVETVRLGPLKYIDAPSPELYDLRRDPRELSNLIDREPHLAHDLRRGLVELSASWGDAEASLELDHEASERLRRLGYLAVGGSAARVERPDPKAVVALHVGLERARQLEQDHLYELAEEQLRRVLEQDPDNLAALVDLSSTLGHQGRIAEAATLLERARSLDPGYVRLYADLAQLEWRRQRPERALELLRLGLDLEPEAVDLRLQEVYLLAALDRLGEAQARLLSLLEAQGDHAGVQLAAATLVELAENDLEGARSRLLEALALDPFLTPAWRALGQLAERRERPEEAIEAYRNGLQRRPNDADLEASLGLLLARRGASDSTRHLREALRLSAEPRSDLRVALGNVLAEQGEAAAAAEEYRRALEVEPSDAAARNNRAVALLKTGQATQALVELEKLIGDFPDYADAYSNLAAVALELQDWNSAESYARKALELRPRSPRALINLGLCHEHSSQLQEARAAYEAALEVEPDYWQARFNLAVLLSQGGDGPQALALFEQVAARVPSYPEVHLELGRLLGGPLAAESGALARARQHLSLFLRLSPDHSAAAEARLILRDLSLGASG